MLLLQETAIGDFFILMKMEMEIKANNKRLV